MSFLCPWCSPPLTAVTWQPPAGFCPDDRSVVCGTCHRCQYCGNTRVRVPAAIKDTEPHWARLT